MGECVCVVCGCVPAHAQGSCRCVLEHMGKNLMFKNKKVDYVRWRMVN